MPSVRNPLLLVVDDDAVDRRRVRRALQNEFEIVEATTGDEALEQAESKQPTCVLLDFELPGTDTMQVLRSLTERLIPVVLYTGHGNEAVAGAAVQAGVYGYVVKQRDDRQQLLVAVHSAIQRNAAQRNAATLAALIESSSDAIIGATLAGTITSWNGGAQALYGYSPEEVLGQPIGILVPAGRAAALAGMLQAVPDGECVEHLETTHCRKTGERVNVSLTISPIQDARQQIVGTSIIARDVTARVRYEEGLREAQQAAEEANNAKSAFFATVSHELRTPLHGLLGMTELCLDSQPSPQLREYLSAIQFCGEKLLRLLNDVLDFAKIEAGKLEVAPQAFKLRDQVARTLRHFGPQARSKAIKLALRIEPDVPDRLVGDIHRVGQILSNLVSNAIKFTEQGTVTVNIDLASRQDDSLALHFRVIDTGIGIAPELAEAIFEPFKQADASTTRKYGGTGLGLAICSQLVSLMHGRIWAESELGRGSTFHFSLPFVLAHADSDEQRGHETEEIELRSLRFLVAEDNEVSQHFISEALMRRGHSAVIVDDGRQVVRAFRNERFDVVLMDLEMPGLDGLEATAAIRQIEHSNASHTPIIAMTAHTLNDDRNRCRAAGMDGYVTKPVRLRDLFWEIAVLLPDAVVRTGDAESCEVDERQSDDPKSKANVLDLESLFDRVEGDGEWLSEMVSVFFADYPGMLGAIRSAIDEGNAQRLESSAHAFKGAVSNFYARQAIEAAQALVNIGRSRSLDGAEDAYSRLEHETRRIHEELQRLQWNDKASIQKVGGEP